MKNKRVAVLMSTYNGEKYLKDQIESIINQKTSCELCLWIRDDGSKDTTIDIIEHYCKIHDNIKLIKGDNRGCNASFFELLKKVEGYDFYAFSDQDDIWLEDKIEKGITKLLENDDNVPCLYGSSSYLVKNDMRPFGETQKPIKDININNTIIQNFIPGHSQIMNESLRKLLIQEIDYSKIYVYDSWITNVAMLYGKIIFDKESHTYYRMHENNEVGFGINKIDWIKDRIKRVKKNDTRKYGIQIEYFYNMYCADINKVTCEIANMLKMKKNVMTRFYFILKTKLYRQKDMETLYFKILYLLGLYN